MPSSQNKKLIIVESPTKAKTISKFLPREYKVLSSYGHVRDLPKSTLAIDVEHDFAPRYIIPPKAKEHVAELVSAAQDVQEVILASDEDREGEAIAWHVEQILSGSAKTKKGAKTKGTAPAASMQRIVFHEITKPAIENALLHPRTIDMRLVDAQQARRVLDRLVGYELSPFLWRKIRYGLSAGRVQSVAVRLVVEREREIQQFKQEEYWSVEGDFVKNEGSHAFHARLISYQNKSIEKMSLRSQTEAEAITKILQTGKFTIEEISSKEVSRSPAPPFTTSTLQQEAARKFGFSAKQTMMVAQQLYENGFITYMRTDSVNLSELALAQARGVIGSIFGEKYALANPRRYSTRSKGAQEAHEAIRPTDLSKQSEHLSLKDTVQRKLYDLIWKRALASQMQPALLEQVAVDIAEHQTNSIFRANGQTIIFDGFIRVYTEGSDDESSENEGVLPPLQKGDLLSAQNITALQHFTQPPPRYTDATLVKALEANGIGRPSTYAPTLSTIQERGYVEKIDKKYAPTEIGYTVNDMLVEHFPEIVDINFTSHIEEELDEIADGKITWTKVCDEFYRPFKKHLEEKELSVEKKIEISDTPCPHCGKPMIIKHGRLGRFLACPDPESKVTLPLPEEAAKIKELTLKTRDEKCPLCGGPMEVKRGRFGYFLGCARYPECKGIAKIWNKIGFICPHCLASTERKDRPGELVERKGRGRSKPFYGCTRYPECDFVLNQKPQNQDELEKMYAEWKTAPKKKAGRRIVKSKK